MVISITKRNFKREIEQSSKPIIIDVWAEWCGPCKVMEPIFRELEQELGSKYTFAKINVDEAREITSSYGVSSIPAFVFIKNNKVLSIEMGSMSKDTLASKIHELFD
jgi:thioredoxin 1